MENEVALRIQNVTKVFPGVRAVDDVSFDILKGEVHAILGHNGAGKSTLVKIISGAYQRDSGSIQLYSKEVHFKSPHDGIENGVCMVYQELDLIPYLDGAENIFLGQSKFTGKAGFIDKKSRYLAAEEIIKRFGVDIDLHVPVRQLSISKQQLITIAKAISHHAKVIIFDEPTATLNDLEVSKLFSIMKWLKDQGIALIWITHRLNEVFEMADHVTLMRDGKKLSTHSIADIQMKEIVEALTGVREEERNVIIKENHNTGKKVLSCEKLGYKNIFSDISFDLYEGEVLGLTGLMGCGSTEIAKSLFSAYPHDRGTISIGGEKLKRFSPEIAVKNGIAYISEDRKGEGLNLIGSVKSNLVITILHQLQKWGFIKEKDEKDRASIIVDRLSVRMSGLGQLVGNMSGGNQQKVVLGKWLLKEANIFIMCEPTRGIDVGAKREIHRIIRDLAADKKAVLVVSSEEDEILETCDRIIVLYEGKQKAELLSNECNKAEMMNLIYGV